MQAERRRLIKDAARLAALSALPVLSAPALAKLNGTTQRYHGDVFGTQWRLILQADENPDTALKNIARILELIDTSISPFRENSILSQFNRSSNGISTVNRSDFLALVRTGLNLAKITNGAFDPTVGPLVNRFGFGPINGSEDCRHTDVHCTDHAIKKAKAGVTLDLCGLGKGYAVDIVGQSLRQHGYQHFLFDIGGEFFGAGHHPSGRPWRVQLEQGDYVSKRSCTVALTDLSIATSGLQFNKFEFKGQHYGHLINRKTASAPAHLWHSVSVVHTSATLADAWSTALFVAQPAQALMLAKRNNIDAYFMSIDDQQQSSVSTGQFRAQVSEG